MHSNPSRILITGCSGFVGRHLAPLCQAEYPRAELFGMWHGVQSGEHENAFITLLEGDIRNREHVREILARARPDWIIHLAGQASVAESWKHPDLTLAINAGGVVNLLEEVHAAGLQPRVVLIGSAEEYGAVAPEENPISEQHQLLPVTPYAVSKAAQDLFGFQYYASYALPILRVRAFNHFGPYQPPTYVIASFARQIALIEAGRVEPIVRVGNLTAQRDFLSVHDVVRAYLALAAGGRAGEAYNVGSGVPTPIEKILDMLISQSTLPITVRVDPELFRPVDVPVVYADTARLQHEIGWKPEVPLLDALIETLNYWRQQIRAEPPTSGAAASR
ncbi:MAG: GDP-mannose 4,6-dehydratase [Ktedonobacterales bacterium]